MELNISNAEMRVMRVIWSRGASKVEEVMKQLPKEVLWTPATVKTLLGRLVKKGMLATEKEGRCFVYSARISECDAIDCLGADLLDKVCQMKQAVLLSDLIESAHLTPESVSDLIAQLENKGAQESPVCTCLSDQRECMVEHESISA